MIAASPETIEGVPDCEAMKMTGENRTAPFASMKPLLDNALALILLLISSPIVLLALILVRLTSRGPALFSQKRLGHAGRTITIYKIRTMYQDCERHSGPIWSLPGDRRVTRVGGFLHRTHLDELPQLVNVLRGEMSLIGPRPERPEIADQLRRALPDYSRRLQVRPGLTGLVQVLQPPDTDLDSVRRKLDYDLYYVERMSLWLDVRITIGTLLHLLGISGERVAPILGFPWGSPHREAEAVLQAESVPASSPVRPYYVN